jgi:O-antigen/teichoic acid export membrane protein
VTAARGLREDFVWTFAGNAVSGLSQWAILSVLAKLGGTRMLGEYALAVSIAAPISMLSHLNLRAVLATDTRREHPLGDYLRVRISASAAALIVIAVVGMRSNLSGAVVLAGLSLAADSFSDLYYGALQRREGMRRIAVSMIARGLLSVTGCAAVLAFGGGLIPALAAVAIARILVGAFYDRPRGTRGESTAVTTPAAQWSILRAALPLGAVLMLIALTTNLPRYAIERHLGTAELGVFAAVASFVTIGYTALNAIGQSATSRLARHYATGNVPAFRHVSTRVVALGGVLGIAGVACALVMGEFVLAVLYRPEFAAYSGVLVATLAAATLMYTGSALGYVNTSIRAFDQQTVLLAAVAASCGIASFALVPRIGLYGAPCALAIAAVVQIAGQLAILRRKLAVVHA